MGGGKRAGASVPWQPGRSAQPIAGAQTPALAKQAALQGGRQPPQNFTGLMGMMAQGGQMQQRQAPQQQIDQQQMLRRGLFGIFGLPSNFNGFGGRY